MIFEFNNSISIDKRFLVTSKDTYLIFDVLLFDFNFYIKFFWL